jgi:hypothetical protein
VSKQTTATFSLKRFLLFIESKNRLIKPNFYANKLKNAYVKDFYRGGYGAFPKFPPYAVPSRSLIAPCRKTVFRNGVRGLPSVASAACCTPVCACGGCRYRLCR